MKRDQVYELMAQGMSVREVAGAMGLTTHAVHHHVKSLRENPKGRDTSVLRRRQVNLPYVAKVEMRHAKLVWGQSSDFFNALGSERILRKLIDDCPAGMNVCEWIAAFVVDAYAEEEK